jgi:hypothetical protein
MKRKKKKKSGPGHRTQKNARNRQIFDGCRSRRNLVETSCLQALSRLGIMKKARDKLLTTAEKFLEMT